MSISRGSRAGRLRLLSLSGTGFGLLLTSSAPALSAGFYLQEQSVRGWGRANSGEVADQGPASLWWNPAASARGDGQSRIEVAVGATAILPSGRVENDGSLIDGPFAPPAPVGGDASQKNPIQKGVLPNTSVALHLSDRLAAGLTIASPYTFTTDYDANGWQRYSALRTRLFTVDIQPSLAYAPNDWLSLGAALNVEYAEALLSNALPNIIPGTPDGKIVIEGDGVDLGWSAGAQLRPAPRVTLGIAYKSAIEHKLEGDLTISGLSGPLAARNMTAGTNANFSTPWQLIVGGRAGVSDRITLNAQATRFGWSKFDQLEFGAPLGPTIENYRDTWSFAFGVDADVSEQLVLRTGIQLDQTPTRDASRDPRVPDGNRINYTIGASYRLSPRVSLDAGAGYTDPEAVAITRDERFYPGTLAQTDVSGNGRAVDQHVVVLSLGGRIGF